VKFISVLVFAHNRQTEIMASRVGTANAIHLFVALVLGPHRSRSEVTRALQSTDVLNLALVSTGVFAVLLSEEVLRMRNVLRVPTDQQRRAFRPVVAFAGSWPGCDEVKVSARRWIFNSSVLIS
jgi:hypothetical protein